jgi:hypothetical protein
MIRGTAKFDGIALGELQANFLGTNTKLTAKAAFVSSESGFTHGWTTMEQWSPETLSKLKELRTLMEADLARVHFSGAAGPASPGLHFSSPVPEGGLGEYVNGDAPSI